MNVLTNNLRLFLLLLLLGILSCEEPVDWEFHPGENGHLVVDGILTDELRIQEVRLSLSYDELNGSPIPVSGAVLRVSDGQNSVAFLENPDEPGHYLSEHLFAAQRQIVYTLEIEWEGQTYLAADEMVVPVFPIGPIDFIPVGETDSLSLGEVAPLYANHEQALYEVNVHWSHLFPSDTSRAQLFFYTFRTIDVNELFRPPSETVVFPRGSIVLIQKYALSDQFAAYLRALLMEAEWQGGVFDEASGSLPTNVSNGGLGFFGICATIRDTLIAQ